MINNKIINVSKNYGNETIMKTNKDIGLNYNLIGFYGWVL